MQNNTESNSQRDVFFTGEFKRNLRQLAKKYRRIKKDIQPVLTNLAAGNVPGDQIPGIAFEIYKVRIRNSDSAKGKSGGYRIVYQKTEENTIILITIYSKTEQSDIPLQEIQSIINKYEQEQSKSEEESSPQQEETANDKEQDINSEVNPKDREATDNTSKSSEED